MNVDIKKICEIGFKVVLAVGTGIAVFAGVNKAISPKKVDITTPNDNLNNNSNSSNESMFQNQQPTYQPAPVQQMQPVNDEVVVSGLRATQDTCGKLLSFIQSLTVVAENIYGIFGKKGRPTGQYPQQGYCWGNNVGIEGYTRVSPFIVQAQGYNSNGYNYNHYQI